MSNSSPSDGIDEIKRMVLAGDKIGAIKLYRERSGVGLAEAKSAIEQMQAQWRGFESVESLPPKAGPAAPIQTAAISEALFAGNKIQAIKLYRQQTKADLKDSKRAVEEIEAHLRASAPGLFVTPPGNRYLPVFLVVVALGFGIWKLLRH